MYDLINRHFDRLLGIINREDIDPYIWMIQELPNRDVAHDEEFQKICCSYWALNGAGLGQTFRAEYFSLMERARKAQLQARTLRESRGNCMKPQ